MPSEHISLTSFPSEQHACAFFPPASFFFHSPADKLDRRRRRVLDSRVDARWVVVDDCYNVTVPSKGREVVENVEGKIGAAAADVEDFDGGWREGG